MPLIPALSEAERQVVLCEFEASLVYRASSKRARATQSDRLAVYMCVFKYAHKYTQNVKFLVKQPNI